MCLFRKKKVANKSNPSDSKEYGLGKDFLSLLDDQMQKSKEEPPQTKNHKNSLGRVFYSLLYNTNVATQDKASRQKYMDQRKKSIICAYNGDNVRELSLQYHCSQKEIVQILRESIAKNDKGLAAREIQAVGGK